METSTDYIEDYISNKVSAEDRKSFDERLKTDTIFAKEVEEHIILLNSFDERQAQELLARFTAIEAELEDKKVKILKSTKYLRWAAVIAVLAAVSILVYQSNNRSTTELFLAYYTVYPNVESPISRSGNEGADVWQSYEKGDYEEAYQQFEQNIAINEADMASRFYLGISALETNRLKEAENAFSLVSVDQENKFTEQAKWYLSLTYLKANKKKDAVNTLDEIIKGNSSYADKAKAVLADLE